ncbi:MAG: WD40-repeat-containing domain protein [Piptocephalis tieghemiana]|nr:MAG: WD40-repeat-containing domain protein [Piptocephalis tieghemiana]
MRDQPYLSMVPCCPCQCNLRDVYPSPVYASHLLPHLADGAGTPRKELYSYHAPWPVYSIAWSRRPGRNAFRLAVGSFTETATNKLQVVRLAGPDSEDPRRQQDLVATAEANHPYPATKVLWQPYRGGDGPDLLATTADTLRLWQAKPTDDGASESLHFLQALNSTKTDISAPLTSFDWCEADPSLIVTSSVDTTCTVWNVETRQAKTQLIAHDREVFDVAFISGTSDIFASVGADGSVRMFDLRSLDHSSIIYETPTTETHSAPPLLRLAANKVDTNYLACFHQDSSAVQILDVRVPGTPVAQLRGHGAGVNTVDWSPESSGHICTGGDDSQVLVWDIRQRECHPGTSPMGRAKSAPVGLGSVRDPSLAYTAAGEVNQAVWSAAQSEWIAIAFGRCVQALKA